MGNVEDPGDWEKNVFHIIEAFRVCYLSALSLIYKMGLPRLQNKTEKQFTTLFSNMP